MSGEGFLRARRLRDDGRLVKYLVDANVLSEPTRPAPMPGVVEWLRRNEREIAVDPVVLGELKFGILLLPRGKRRTALEHWFEAGVGRLLCLPWEAQTGLQWAQLLAGLRAAGRAMPIKDSLIAATALVHDLTVVTRNRADFEKAAVRIVDPFETDA
jgi:predicted nucleic acid-binding protein